MLGSRKVIVKARLPVHELAEFDHLAAGAGLSRSRLVNIALGALLESEDVRDPSLWRKRRVRFLLDDSTYARLCEAAKRLGARRTDVIRLAVRKFAESAEVRGHASVDIYTDVT